VSAFRTSPITDFGREIVLAAAIVVAIAIFALVSPSFLSPANIANVGIQSSMILVVAVGMTVVIIAGGIDLSVGSLAGFVSMLAVWLIVAANVPAGLALTAAVISGSLVGALHGAAVAFLGVPGIIVTLGSMTALRGLTSLFANGAAIQSDSPALSFLAWGDFAGFPFPIVIVGAIALVGHALLEHTRLGRNLFAVGGNAQAARAAGISIHGVVVASYAISGFAAALAGLIAASRSAAGSPIIGTGWELEAIAVVVLGGANLFGGSGRIAGTVLAGFLLAIIENGVSLLAITSWVEGVLIGSLLIGVVALNALSGAGAFRRHRHANYVAIRRGGS
jgi:ribose/xylose/arabinose/galactoside ABC-type transport system permease subunit